LVHAIFWVLRMAEDARRQDRTCYASDVGAAQSGDAAPICPVSAIVGGVSQMDVAVISRLSTCGQAK
jgi:hypothetical protein